MSLTIQSGVEQSETTGKENLPHKDCACANHALRSPIFAMHRKSTLEKSISSLSIASVQERLDYFRDAVHGAAKSNFRKNKNKSADWYEAHTETITPAIEEK